MSSNPNQSRRRFVKTFLFGTVFSRMLGRSWTGTVFAEVMPEVPVASGKFTLRLSEFPSLQQENGSVRLGINPLDFADEFPFGDFYPIIINRTPDNRIFVFDSECSHAGCVVSALDPDFGIMACPCHGSIYDIDGTPIAGPALGPLRRYDYVYDGVDSLTVEIPRLGYSVSVSTGAVETGVRSRMRLGFRSFPEVLYEVRLQPAVGAPWGVVPFSETADGPADQFELFGRDRLEAVYVDRSGPRGFYAVVIKLLDLT